MFHFKQFSIDDSLCSMKVGTDGVLLGAWAEVSKAQHVLDVGTGSGLCALMCAQRSAADITAVEIDPQAALQAQRNICNSPFSSRIHVLATDFCNFESTQLFDTIISNPPFFVDSLLPPNKQRSQARHAQTLPFVNLVHKSALLLRPHGTLQLILPYDIMPLIIDLCAQQRLYLKHQTSVITKAGKPPRRSLLRFEKSDRNSSERTFSNNELILYNEENSRTAEFQQLTEAYYITPATD